MIIESKLVIKPKEKGEKITVGELAIALDGLPASVPRSAEVYGRDGVIIIEWAEAD